MKKSLCILLSLITILSCGIFTAVNSVAKASAPVPTLYIEGQGGRIYTDKTGNNSEYVYPLDLDAKELFDKAMTLNVPFAVALATGDWNSWCDTFVGIATDIFEPIALDKSGNPKGLTGARKNKYFDTNIKNELGEYNIDEYSFKYDWRLDYEDIIDSLHKDILRLCKATKFDKINLNGRCIGANIVLAYVNKYGTEHINKIILYCAGIDGFELLGKIYTGDMSFDKDAIMRFINNYLDSSDFTDKDTMNLITDLINIISTTRGLENTLDEIIKYYSCVYENVIPRILRETLGRFGSFWGLIGDEYYEDAKRFIFGGYEDEYSELIKKIDYTHYNVTNKSREIINKCIDSGVNVYIVAKYGLQMVPVIDDVFIQSDSVLELSSATGGATCSGLLGTLDYVYLNEAKEKGTSKYISPDLQVDASTAFLPDHTWFIKDCTHMNMPDCINELFGEILSYDGYMTVFDNRDYPQYMVYDSSKSEISPLTAENSDTNDEFEYKNFFQRIISIIKSLFKILKNLIFAK